MDILYSMDRAAYGPVHNLSKVSRLSKKLSQFHKTISNNSHNARNRMQHLIDQSDVSEHFKLFSKDIIEVWSIDLVFVDKLVGQRMELRVQTKKTNILFKLVESYDS